MLLLIPQAARAQTVEWIHLLGTGDTDESHGVSADDLGNVYISGFTFGSLGGPNAGFDDAFVSKYDAAGNLLWIRQLGTSSIDESWAVSADDAGNVYLSGYTYDSLGGPNAGQYDAFVSKYDAAGNFLWTQQFGTSVDERSGGVSTDGLGNVYVSGLTFGSLAGPNAGSGDVFVRTFDASGNPLWTRQFGTNTIDDNWGVSADSAGDVYLSGYTHGSFGGPSAGGGDAFVAKIVPEPSSLAMITLVAVISWQRHRRVFA